MRFWRWLKALIVRPDDCLYCMGRGYVRVATTYEWEPTAATCEHCLGTGWRTRKVKA